MISIFLIGSHAGVFSTDKPFETCLELPRANGTFFTLQGLLLACGGDWIICLAFPQSEAMLLYWVAVKELNSSPVYRICLGFAAGHGGVGWSPAKFVRASGIALNMSPKRCQYPSRY